MESADEVPRHRRLTRLFLGARTVAREERAEWLAQACAGDEALRAELEELLAADEADGPLGDAALQQDAASRRLGAVLTEEEEASRADVGALPARIGPFRPREVLGRGGMAIVYLAEQDAPRRDVALKVLRGDVSEEAAARIEHEAEVLARLDHPGIARVYSAGRAETPWGEQGYIAMELVNGRQLLRFAREEALSVRARLELVSAIAEALQVAHAAGIVHRDLKPSNVLVQRDGTPKLLDFGVARTEALGLHAPAHTRTGQIVGTLASMAPEQAAGSPDVDARADVYALGVLLYELCAERLPIDTRGLPLHEAVRRIQHEDPAPLGAIRPELRGDVETIVHMALEKEPARRYRDAGAFAADLRSYLADRPIQARPQRLRDRARRFVQRHRALVAGLTVAFVALAGTLVVSLLLLDRARDENRRLGRVREAALRLTDLRRLEQLEHSAAELWPADPSRSAELDAWMAEAVLLVAKLDRHREQLEQLEARLESPRGQERLARQDDVESKITDELWMLEAQSVLVAGLEAFTASGGSFERLVARREFAASLRERTVVAASARWAEAARSVAEPSSPYASAAGPGFELPVRVGLSPLGPDARTGLYAFALDAPGLDEPRWDAGGVTGPEGGAAVVLLLPATAEEPALFVAAREVSAQLWSAFEGSPVLAATAAEAEATEAADEARGAQTFVSLGEAATFAARLGGRLPTESEWERALSHGLAGCADGVREWVRGAEPGAGVLRRGDERQLAAPRLRAADVGFRFVLEVAP